MQYRLTCQCGRSYPVEPRQAGGTLVCECGETINIPTMLKMKRLPVWGEEEEAAPEKDEAVAPATDAVQPQNADDAQKAEPKSEIAESRSNADAPNKEGLSARRWGLFIVASCLLLVSVFFIFRNIHYPNPRAVFYKQTTFRENGKELRRDSSPITGEDYSFYFLPDPEHPYMVEDRLIDAFNDFYAYQYFEFVRELDLSDNFYDNYSALVTRWKMRLVGFGLLALISLGVALFALFAKESQKQVGSMRGESWR